MVRKFALFYASYPIDVKEQIVINIRLQRLIIILGIYTMIMHIKVLGDKTISKMCLIIFVAIKCFQTYLPKYFIFSFTVRKP